MIVLNFSAIGTYLDNSDTILATGIVAIAWLSATGVAPKAGLSKSSSRLENSWTKRFFSQRVTLNQYGKDIVLNIDDE